MRWASVEFSGGSASARSEYLHQLSTRSKQEHWTELRIDAAAQDHS